MQVVITDTAKLDLHISGDSVRPHNSARAASFIEKRLDHCLALADCPRRSSTD